MLTTDPARGALMSAEAVARNAVWNNCSVPPEVVSTLLAGLDRLHLLEQRAAETSEDTADAHAAAAGLYILTGQERKEG